MTCNKSNVLTDNAKYVGWSADEAVKHYLVRMSAKIPHFETMEESDINYIKVYSPSRSKRPLKFASKPSEDDQRG